MKTVTLQEFCKSIGSQRKASKAMSIATDRMSRMFRSTRDLRVDVDDDGKPIRFYEAEKIFYSAD